MKLTVPKGLGTILGNTLRQVSLAGAEVWRPIAFSVDRKFNLIEASGIVQDSYMVMAEIQKLTFIPKESLPADQYLHKWKFAGELYPKAMTDETFSIVGEEKPIITCLDGYSVELSIYFRKSSGVNTVQDNSTYLHDVGIVPDEWFVMSSRHTDVETFAFSISPHSDTTEVLEIRTSSGFREEKQILGEAAEAIRKMLSSL